MKFSYDWSLKNAVFTKDKGKVFSCFACGGGSTMGYKLAGFDVLGCNEIDPKMIEVYKANHHPKYAYLEPIQTFKLKNDLPIELFNLDILDGSPPCSSFSVAGNREDDWGKEKKFREGQSNQILDTLFFDFIDLAKKLQPKVVIAENVKGLLMGEAKDYVRSIYRDFDLAGYYVQHWLLEASKMGVPQKRPRVFFIALRKDLAEPFLEQVDMFTVVPKIIIDFNEMEIPFSDIYDGLGRDVTEHIKQAWEHRDNSDSKISHAKARAGMKETDFNCHFAKKDKVLHTLTAKGNCGIVLYDEPKYISDTEFLKGCAFPSDYNFCGTKPTYLMGMSVPPIMTAQIANCIYDQWLSKITAL